MNGYLIVFLGAGLGGATRHGFNVACLRLLGSDFPYSTLLINIIGSALMGLLVGYFAAKADPGMSWRLFLTTGILGGFTTFSTFSLDAAVLAERGQLSMVALYVVSSVGLGIAGLFAGLFISRQLI